MNCSKLLRLRAVAPRATYIAAAAALLGVLASSADAATLTFFSPSASGTSWNTTATGLWTDSGGGAVTWSNSNAAIFTGTARTVTIDAGDVILTGSLALLPTSGTFGIQRSGSSRLVLSGGTFAISTNATNNGISAPIVTDVGSVLTYSKSSGNQALSLSGSNSIGGSVNILQGRLTLDNANALAGATGVTVQNNGVLGVNAVTVTGVDVVLNGLGGGANGGSALQGGNTTGGVWAGGVTLNTGTVSIGSRGGIFTVSGTIGEAGGSRNLLINSAGVNAYGVNTVKLSGSNTYTGTTTLRTGTLMVGANALSGTSGALGNATSAVQLGDTATTTGTVTLLTDGAFTVGRDINVANFGSLTVIGGNQTSGTSAFTGNITLNKAVTLRALAGSEVGFSTGSISGGFGVTVEGGGTVALAGSNSYSGTTTLASGALSLGGSNALAGGGNVTFTGGTLQFTANNTADYASRIVGSSGAMAINTNGQTVSFGALVSSNTAGLTKLGSGTVALTGSTSFTGTITASGSGALLLTSSFALGAAGGTNSVTTGASFVLPDGMTISGENLSLASIGEGAVGGLKTESGTATWAGNITVNSADARLGAETGATLVVSGSILGGSHNDLTISGRGGTGTVLMGAGSSLAYTGTTKIVRGILAIGKDNALPVGTTLDVDSVGGVSDSAVFDLNGFNQTVAALQDTATTNITGTVRNGIALTSSTLTVNGGATTTFDGVLDNGAGSLSLVKAGAGALTLNGNSAISNVNVTGGTLTLAGSNTISGSTSVNSATLVVANASALGSAPVSATASAVQFTSSSGTASGAATITLNTSSSVQLTSGVTVGNPVIHNATSGQNVIQMTSASGTATLAGNVTWGSSRDLRINVAAGGTLDITGTISGGDSNQAIMFNRSNTGTVILSASNTYLGGGYFVNGQAPAGTIFYSGITKLGTDNALPSSAALTFQPNTTFDLNGRNQTVASAYQGGGSGALPLRPGTITNGAVGTTGTLTFNTNTDAANITHLSNSSAYQFLTAAVLDGAGTTAVVKSGSATMTFVNSGSYSGGTTVNSGTLRGFRGGAFGSGNVTVNGGVLDVNFGSFAASGTSGSQSLGDTSGATVILAGGNVALNGRANSSGGVFAGTTTVAGGGAPADGRLVTLTGTTTAGLAVGMLVTGSNIVANNFIAAIIDDTRFMLSLAGATSSAGPLTLSAVNNTTTQTYGGLQVNSTGTVAVNRNGGDGATLSFGTLAGAAALTKTGDGLLRFTGTSTGFTGALNGQSGTVAVTGSIAGSFNATVDAGATLDVSVPGLALQAGRTLDVNGTALGALDIAGTLSGTGSAGNTTVSTGTLAPGNSIGTLSTGTLSLNAASTFALEINTTAATADRVNVTGDLNIATGAALTLADLGANAALPLETVLTIIDYSGTWNGGLFTYSANELADGEEFAFGANSFQIDYDYLGGTEVALLVVPEPSAALSLLCGAGLLALFRRRR
jgi:autotransporter-associated beta strand protein